jgi:hypothetical protein
MSISPADWKGVPAPTVQLIEGRFIRLERLDPTRHGDDLFNALQGPGADPKLWDYLPYGPFPERGAFNDWLNNHAASSDPYFFSVIDRASGEVQGLLSLMSIVPAQGRIEIGHVTCWPRSRSPSATGAWSGNATTATPAPNTPPSGWASVSKASSASTWWSRDRTATPPGTRLLIRSGRRLARGSSAG